MSIAKTVGMQCPCGSSSEFEECCQPYLTGKARPPTAEALMRSRYTAHTTGQIAYIRETLAPESLKDFDEKTVREWASKSDWMGLKILSVKDGQAGDAKGIVEFVATYKAKGKVTEHHEVSHFRYEKSKERWVFVDGESHVHEDGKGHQHHHHEPIVQVVRDAPKIGRNDPCHCGSGKKFKKCHGAEA